MEALTTLAIDIGGSKFSIAVFEGDVMAHRETHATDRAGGHAWMLAQVVGIARNLAGGLALDRCGIGFGGPVDFAAQSVARSMHVGGWQDFALSAYIERELGLPTVMDNDANVGALGEARYGAGVGYDPLLYITVSTGIGGGIIIGGQPYRGASSFAGEIGHIPVRPGGFECLCGGRGCLERLCSGLWLERDYGRPARELLQDAAFVRPYVVDLALGIKSAIRLLNPALTVIGGGISKAGDALFGPLREELQRQLQSSFDVPIDVVPAALGDDAVLYGAMALAKAR